MKIRARSMEVPAGGKALTTSLLLAAFLISGVLLATSEPAHAATTFTVNSTSDQSDANRGDGRCDVDLSASGNQCTLRAAIEQANEVSGADDISFDIPGGSGVKTIRPASRLPVITEAVTIDGYTQPGTKKNTQTVGTDAVLLIQIDGTNAGFNSQGLRIDASNVVVRGLAINRFKGSGDAIAILLLGASARIEGNFLGTDASGTQDLGNDEGIQVVGLDTTVGGATPASRNLISGNDEVGIALVDADAKVQGNLIGAKKDGASALGNGFGLGIVGSNNTIGGDAPGEANTIAFNGEDGVTVGGDSNTGNRILSNSIFSNEGLGIDLDFDGVTSNDPKDPDTGPNNLQNFPVLDSIKRKKGKTTVKGTLNSKSSTTFTLQLFSNPSGEDEGQTFLGQKKVKTDGSGNASFSFKTAQKVKGDITATATDAGGNTSEFSTPRTVKGR